MTAPLRTVLPLLLLACNGGQDPILDRAAAMEDRAGGEAAPIGPGPAEAPAPAAPEAPPPGVPEEPVPVAGQPSNPGGAGPASVDGPTVEIRGTVDVPGWKGGPIRVDIFDGDQQAAAIGSGPRPSVVAVARLESPGAFSLQVPASTGRIWIGAFADENQDGRPGHEDPTGWYGENPVSTEKSTEDVALTLEPPPPPPGR